MADYTQSSATRTTVTTVTVSATRPQLDLDYVKTLPGILKVVEIILSIIVFICSVANWCSWHGHAGFGAFVGFMGFILTTALLVLNVVHFYEAYPQVPWIVIELGYYALWTFFYLVAGSCLAALSSYWSNCRAGPGAGAFFAFAAMLVFGFDAFLKFRDWRSRVTLARGTGGPSNVNGPA